MSKTPLWEFLSASWHDHAVIYAVATWSGLVTHLHRMKSKKTRFSLLALTVDVLLSGLAGVMMGWVCQWLAVPSENSSPLVLIAAGIAGHSAPRTLWLLGRRLHRWLRLSDE